MAETVRCGACAAEITLDDPILLAECVCGAEVRSTRHPASDGTGSTEIDLYKVLGVERSASADEIRDAYRRRARETHPDVGGDPTEFQTVQSAYETL
ncbi:MAG: J domain-containing protein, partial [Ilumatobacter sp.]